MENATTDRCAGMALRPSQSPESTQLVTPGCWWPRRAPNVPPLAMDARWPTRIPAPQPPGGHGYAIAVKQATSTKHRESVRKQTAKHRGRTRLRERLAATSPIGIQLTGASSRKRLHLPSPNDSLEKRHYDCLFWTSDSATPRNAGRDDREFPDRSPFPLPKRTMLMEGVILPSR